MTIVGGFWPCLVRIWANCSLLFNVWKIQSLTLNQSPIQQIAKSQLICFNFSKLERLNYLVFLKSI